MAEVWTAIDPVGTTFVDKLGVETGRDAFPTSAQALEEAEEVELSRDRCIPKKPKAILPYDWKR